MNWFKGNIAEAVAESKARNAIFVVFVEGKDEPSKHLIKIINDDKIREKLQSDDFVTIKIESESQTYLQFASIYRVVPVPSIFFIGKSGTPLDIATGIVASAGELQEKIEKVLVASNKSTPAISLSSSFMAGDQQQQIDTGFSSTSLVASTSLAASTIQAASTSHAASTSQAASTSCLAAVARPTEAVPPLTEKSSGPKEPAEKQKLMEIAEVAEKAEIDVKEKEKLSEQNESTSDVDTNARLEETRRVLEEKRRERVEKEKKLEKEKNVEKDNELRRRREDKDLFSLQQWQKEQDFKELKENLRRERLAEQTARERVLAQIAADRAERAKKTAAEAILANEANSSDEQKTNNNSPQSTGTDMARLQFRLSNGSNKSHSFDCQETLSTVRTFVRSELLPGTGIKDFILATTYPKRELTVEHESQTLMELGLFPSAVILVIGKQSHSPGAIIARSGGIINIVSTIFWTLLSPIFTLYGYIRNIGKGGGADGKNRNDIAAGSQKRTNEYRSMQHETAKRRNLDRFTGGASTSQDAEDATNAADDDQPNPYRRYGSSNIHRLSDNHNDSDDENATWNGNSTQQQ